MKDDADSGPVSTSNTIRGAAQPPGTAGQMADDRFAPGAFVQRSTRGPIMTLVRYSYLHGGRQAHCQWFERPGELGEGFFLDAELTPYKPGHSAGTQARAATLTAARLLLRVGCALVAPWLVRIAYRSARRVPSSTPKSRRGLG